MAEQSFLAKLGLRTGTLGSLASLAIALPLATGDYSPAAATDASRIGFFGDRTPAAEKLSTVVMGVEALRVRAAGVDTLVKLTTAASAVGGAGFNLPPGTAPAAPVDGDLWTTATVLAVRINGATQTLVGGAGATNRVASWSSSSTLTGSASVDIVGNRLRSCVNAANIATSVTIGDGAGSASLGANNTVVGAGSAAALAAGASNTVIGAASATSLTGSTNVVIGAAAATSATGNQNTVVGASTATGLTGNWNNVIIGDGIASGNAAGSVLIGSEVVSATATGLTVIGRGAKGQAAGSVIIGYQAGFATATATNSTIVGYQAATSITGANNTLIGYQAGADATTPLTSGTDNVIIGHSADVGGSTVSNAIVIGSLARCGSNHVAIGYNAATNAGAVDCTAIGAGASANGTKTTAVGRSALATGDYGVAIGASTTAAGGAFAAVGATAASGEVVFGFDNVSAQVDALILGRGSLSTAPNAITIRCSNGSGTNITGGNIVIQAGRGTGNANGGSVVIQSSLPGTSGTGLRSAVDLMTLAASAGITMSPGGVNAARFYNDGGLQLGGSFVASPGAATLLVSGGSYIASGTSHATSRYTLKRTDGGYTGGDFHIGLSDTLQGLSIRGGVSTTDLFGVTTTAITANLGFVSTAARVVGTRSITSAGATTVLAATDDFVVVTGTNTETLTLPAAASGRRLMIKNRSTGAVTINRAGADTIDGGTTTSLVAGAAVMLLANGTDWTLN